MTDSVEAFRDVRVENILRQLTDARENGFNGVVARASWSKAVAVGLELGFPFGFQGEFNQRLPAARSATVGMPKGRCSSVPGFGIQTRRMGCGEASTFRLWASSRRSGGFRLAMPSTPGVFLPWLSWVTRRTASTLAYQDRSRRRCKAWTVFVSACWEAR